VTGVDALAAAVGPTPSMPAVYVNAGVAAAYACTSSSAAFATTFCARCAGISS
jgi:hypothetical protein